ncbi:MAG: VWA domain-containing protein, partial [Flavobacteriaceae bacterium]|nr:VWA domain-containing protein [Flavobacteriaceae bacterium]
MNWEFGNYRYFGLLLVLLMAAYLLWDFSKWRKKKRDFFAESRFQKHVFGEKSRFSGVLVLCYVVSFLLLILSFVDIVKNEKTEMSVEKASSDVIFLVDVSNSMNSNDIEPSRLEQAKLILNKTLNQLGEERVGIVVFAGEARTMMPLTTDYSSVDIYLENLSSDLIKRQGTDFLLAMEETEKKLKKGASGLKKVVLISDGEDNEGNHDAAVNLAQKNNIAVTSVGIGTEEGGTIPELQFDIYQDYKKDEDGNTVITKRETQALKTISEKTGGVYIDGNSVERAANEIIKDIKSNQKEGGRISKIIILN